MENRVTAIKNLVPLEFWRQCPRKEKPANLPSKGMNASFLSESQIWLSGPGWLWHRNKEVALLNVSEIGIPEECLSEMKCKDLTCLLVAAGTTKPSKSIS